MDIALQYDDRDSFIFTDSLSALQSLNSRDDSVTVNPHIYLIKQKYKLYRDRDNNVNVPFFFHTFTQGN